MKILSRKNMIIASVMLMFACIIVPKAKAIDSVDSQIMHESCISECKNERTVYVDSESSLKDAISNYNKGENIVFKSNIYMDGDLWISNNDVNIDLNKCELVFKNGSCKVCAEKCVKIQNGTILGSSGTPNCKNAPPTVLLKTGTLYLENISIYGGNGFKGGAFGGNGGCALELQKETEVIANNVFLYGGNAAKGFIFNGFSGQGLIMAYEEKDKTYYKMIIPEYEHYTFIPETTKWEIGDYTFAPVRTVSRRCVCKISGDYNVKNGKRPFLFFN